MKYSVFFRYSYTLIILGIIWHIGAIYFGEFILPKPLNVLNYMFSFLQTKEYWIHAFSSFYRVIIALCIAFSIGFPLGMYMGYKKKFDICFSPFVFLTYPIPKIVFLPLFFMLLGIGDVSRILLISLTVLYQILVVTRASVLSIDKKYFDSFKSLLPIYEENNKKRKHFRKEKLFHLLIPASLPSALTALKIASGTAIAVLFMAESFATQEGLGFLIMDSWGRGDTLPMFSGILSLCFFGIFLYEFCNLLEHYFCKWTFVLTK